MKIRSYLNAALLLVAALVLSSCSTPCPCDSIELFDGKSLQHWRFISADPAVKKEDVWWVNDGILTCKGTPVGAIYIGAPVLNFKLLVEYRWAPGGEPGNSGIFSRIHGDMKPLPRAVEVQLKKGSAGDLLGLQGRKIAPGQPRFFEVKAHPQAGDIAGVRRIVGAEKAPGEWSRVEIEAIGPVYRVWMNGELVNEATGVEQVAGAIGLQSEGGIIQFRKVRLTPL